MESNHKFKIHIFGLSDDIKDQSVDIKLSVSTFSSADENYADKDNPEDRDDKFGDGKVN